MPRTTSQKPSLPRVVHIRTSNGVFDVSIGAIGGTTVGALRAYLETKYDKEVVRLSGQRVTHFKWKGNEQLSSILKRAKSGTNASVVFVVEDFGKGLVYEQLDGYHLVAVTERDYPLPDDVQLRWYSSGAAEYKFEVLRRPGDIKPDEFELYIMIPNTSRLPLLVSHNWTIRRIKTEIAKCTGIPTYKQRLFSKESSGDLLPDYKTIMDCGFHPKDALELSLAGTIDPDQPCKSKGVQATITRPCDIRVRIPKTNRIVALKCDKTDTSAAVKARFAGKMDPQRCRRLVHTLPCVEDAQEDDQDPDEYLEQCLKTLSLDSVGSMGDAALGGDFKELEQGEGEWGDHAQQLMAALRDSMEQVRSLQQQLQLCKGIKAKQRSRRSSNDPCVSITAGMGGGDAAHGDAAVQGATARSV